MKRPRHNVSLKSKPSEKLPRKTINNKAPLSDRASDLNSANSFYY